MSCHMLWIGPTLGAVERACILSVLRQGHDLTLWCYDWVDGIPSGVTIGAADEIVPRSCIVRHRGGSPALFANLFRYELQRRGLGTWLDCDVYLLKPLDLESPYLVAEESPGMLATSILRLPVNSPLLPPLIRIFDEREIPAWMPPRARGAAWIRRLLTGRTGIAHFPWASAGPKAVSALVARLKLAIDVRPHDHFYPVHWREAAWVFDPQQRLADRITPATVAVHLWNECIRDRKHLPAQEGSFLAQLQHEGA